MPYSRITPAKNSKDALDYAQGSDDGKGHNDNDARNLVVGSVGLLPADVIPFDEQFEQLLKSSSSRNKTEARRLIMSFSKNELDPDDPQSPYKALTIAQETMQEGYNGFPSAIFVQNDGKGGKVHVHIIACNVNSITHKGFTDEQTNYKYLEQTFDKVAQNYIDLDYGRTTKDKVTQNERIKREQGIYCWKDDLKQRVNTAMINAKDRDDFLHKLTLAGVEGTYRTSKKQGDYILYELRDTSNFDDDKIPSNLKSKSYKMGSNYDIDALDIAIVKAKPYVYIPPVDEPYKRIIDDDDEQEPIKPTKPVVTVAEPTKPTAEPIKTTKQKWIDRLNYDLHVAEPVKSDELEK